MGKDIRVKLTVHGGGARVEGDCIECTHCRVCRIYSGILECHKQIMTTLTAEFDCIYIEKESEDHELNL